MITQILRTSLISLAIGFLLELTSNWLESNFLSSFFKNNLITLLVALLAINATTMGIVLTKIRDLIEKHGGAEFFTNSRSQMILSVKEQIGLIVVATVLLTIKSSPLIKDIANLPLLINSLIAGIFVYSLIVLYDTAKGVLIIIDFDKG